MRALPASVLWPACAGVLPFAALTLGLWVLPPGWRPAAGEALLGYGAVILSFVGALHWGHALLRRDEALRAGQAAPVAADRAFLFSVCPALAGWTALQLPFVPALGLLGAGFIGQLMVDVHLARALSLPEAFLPFRLRVTAAVLLCLLAASAASALAT
ncbi:MAG: DUF3429 domain-containing protein [Pseudomonadota bacterium]